MTELRRVVTDDEKTAFFQALPQHATPVEIGELFMTMMGMYGLDNDEAKRLVLLLGIAIGSGSYQDYLVGAEVDTGSQETVQ